MAKIELSKSDIKRIRDKIETTLEGAEVVLKRAALEAKTTIIRRTEKGVGFDGRRFASFAYSDEYKKRRRKAGLNPSGNWLRFSGNLMNSISSKVERVGGKLQGIVFLLNTTGRGSQKDNYSPLPPQEAARRVTAKGFKFFGLSPNERKEILRRAVAFLRSTIRK